MRLLVLGLVLLVAGTARADTFTATDVPVSIPDGPSGIAESFMTISDARVILDLDVHVTIRHPFDGDLRLYLEAPWGDVVRLADRCGHGGDDYDSTCFDDEATTAICDGDPPFRGCWIPDLRLWELDDHSALGQWTLRVTDNATGDTGSVIAWSLDVEFSTAAQTAPELPRALTFDGAFPNPFNARTELRFELPQDGPARLVLFDLLGREVALLLDRSLTRGPHTIGWDAGSLAGGVYFAQLRAGSAVLTRKVVLLR